MRIRDIAIIRVMLNAVFTKIMFLKKVLKSDEHGETAFPGMITSIEKIFYL